MAKNVSVSNVEPSKAPEPGPATKPVAAPVRGETARVQAVSLDVEVGTRETPPPQIESSPPFLLKAHPTRWTVIGGQVVPAFGKLKLLPGINSVTQDDRTGKLHFKGAQGRAEEDGWIIIPQRCVPPHHLAEGEVPSYLVQPQGRPDVYLLRYELVYPGSPVRGTNEKGFLEFCAYLLEQGVIQPPPLYVLDRMLEQKRRDHAAMADKAARTNSYRNTVARLAADVEVIEAAIASRVRKPVAAQAAALNLDDQAEAARV